MAFCFTSQIWLQTIKHYSLVILSIMDNFVNLISLLRLRQERARARINCCQASESSNLSSFSNQLFGKLTPPVFLPTFAFSTRFLTNTQRTDPNIPNLVNNRRDQNNTKLSINFTCYKHKEREQDCPSHLLRVLRSVTDSLLLSSLMRFITRLSE